MKELNQYLAQLDKLIELGTEWNIVEEQYEKLMNIFVDNKVDIFFHEIEMLYANQLYKQALYKLIVEYTQNGENLDVYDKIIELFWNPVSDERMNKYQHNCESLLKYELAYGTLKEEPEFYVLWEDEVTIIYTDGKGQIGGIDFHEIGELPDKNKRIAISNELWEKNIRILEENNRIEKSYMDKEIPLILIYDEIEWNLMLQLFSLNKLIELDRVVFIHEKEGVEAYLEDYQNTWPEIFIRANRYILLFQKCIEIQKQIDNENKEKISQYYSNNSERIKKNIQNGKPKILFFTTRFSTALQYHIRDCNASAQKIGCETFVLIETHRTREISYSLIRKVLAEFTPDILFQMDHYRFESKNIWPKEMVFICWAQDLMPYIMSEDTPKRLIERDFVVSMMCDWKPFKDVGYTKKQLISEPIPANDTIYCPQKIAKDEIQKYGADVCMICHGGNLHISIENAIYVFEGELKSILYDAYDSYANYAKETENIFLEEEIIRGFFDEFTKKFYGITLHESILNYIVSNVLTKFNPTLYRQMIADWLIAEKDISIKLWGNGWTQIEAYKPYAMGVATNGEIMSKILQSTKIVIGNNIALTGAARAAETMLSGTFYLSNASVPKHDLCNIFQWFREGEELESFHNRKDLIEKIRYYLKNDEERKIKSEIGRQTALKWLTYDSFMTDVISEVGERLNE